MRDEKTSRKTRTSAGNHGQNLLGEGDDNTACQSEEAIRTLGRIMGLQGQTHLHDTPAQQDQTHGPDHAENKVGQVVDNSERIAAGGRCRDRKPNHHGHSQHGGAVESEASSDAVMVT